MRFFLNKRRKLQENEPLQENVVKKTRERQSGERGKKQGLEGVKKGWGIN